MPAKAAIKAAMRRDRTVRARLISVLYYSRNLGLRAPLFPRRHEFTNFCASEARDTFCDAGKIMMPAAERRSNRC